MGLTSRQSNHVDTVFITPDETNYSLAVGRLAGAFKQKRVVPFLGAGISKAPDSWLPLAFDLIRPLRVALWDSVRRLLRNSPLKAEDIKTARSILKAAPLERLLAVLHETHGRDRTINEYLAALKTNVWNWNHGALGALAAKGYISKCVTLNFDLLIEEAVHAHGGASVTECPLSPSPGQPGRDNLPTREPARFPYGHGTDPIKIIKPHGSLAPEASGFKAFQLVSTTLPEIGDKPDPRNRRSLLALLTANSELLVAGYSDDDWDLFPLLEELVPKLTHVHWIHYAPAQAVSGRRCPWESNPREKKIRDWLTRSGAAFTSYVGDPATLLRAVASDSGVVVKRPPKRDKPITKPERGLFMDAVPADETRLRTAISMAILLQDRGRFNDLLLERLLQHPSVLSNPVSESRLRRVQAHTHHTRRELRPAMRQMKALIDLKCRHYGREDGHAADDLVWLGYEHLCLIKRPGLAWLAGVCHYRKGLRLMLQGARLARRHDRTQCRYLCSMARYYRIDLFHTWAGHALFLGHVFDPIIRTAFKPVARLYDGLRRRHPDLMEWDYYWLRGLEVDLLAGQLPNSEAAWCAIQSKLDLIQHRYDILQNYVQAGNVRVYRALVEFLRSRSIQQTMLKEAEMMWSGPDGTARSGLYRVMQFRRYLGLDGPWQTVKRLSSHLFRKKTDEGVRKAANR
jgi:hypothetical protein